MDWVLSILYILGMYFLVTESKISWAITFVTSWLWIYYSIFMLRPPQYGLVLSDAIAIILSASTGIRVWNERQKHSI